MERSWVRTSLRPLAGAGKDLEAIAGARRAQDNDVRTHMSRDLRLVMGSVACLACNAA